MRVQPPSPFLQAGVAMLAALMLLALPALADKPEGVGGGKGKGGGAAAHGNKGGGGKGGNGKGGGSGGDLNINVDIRFGGDDRVVVRDFYGSMRGCPPGLAKKNNGCMPPGQAKKWAVGHPLPRDVVFYDLPHELVIKLRPPPSGYRYVRVAADILMIAVGTGMVIDAIEDLGRL
ncbi:RcnB family protein [Desertibaculum subflavum]|uniref:RcnB family protein n=1 Tax=Desertibaculum subflavum TaxID=2268458 RepID=UPI0034D1B654